MHFAYFKFEMLILEHCQEKYIFWNQGDEKYIFRYLWHWFWVKFLKEIKNVILKDFIPNVNQNSIAPPSGNLHKHLTFKISNLKMFRTLECNFSPMLIFISNCLYTLTFITVIYSRISKLCNSFLFYYTNIFAIRLILSSAACFYASWNQINPHSLCVFRVLSAHSGKL